MTLQENEAIIERGLEAYREAGIALKEIRDERQYKDTHKTFEAYCRERWQMTRQQANNLIRAADTAADLETNGFQPPKTERVARELKGTLKEKRRTWDEARKEHGPNPTAEQVKNVRVKIKAKTKRPPASDTNGGSTSVVKSKRKKNEPQRTLGPSGDPAVIEWVWDKTDQGWKREEVVAAAKAGTDGWPLPDAPRQPNGEHVFSNGTWSECQAVITHLKRVGMRPTPWPREPQAKVKLRKVEAEIKTVSKPLIEEHDEWRYTGIPIDTPEAGPRIDLLHMRRHLLGVTDLLETRDFSRLHIDSKAAMEMIQDIVYELESLLSWGDRIHTFLQAHLDYYRQLEQVKHMRENTAGRTAPEIQASHKLANLKESKLQPPPERP